MTEVFLRDKKNLLNEAITAREVRLIDEKGGNHGVVAILDALEFARKNSMDLVEIVSDASPPVCRIMDYGKYKFARAKKAQQARKRQKRINVKEIKFRPGTDEADYQTKLKKIAQFLADGDKAKIVVRFRGRELAHQERGTMMLDRVEKDLGELGMVEMEPKKEGRQLIMVLAPGKATRNGRAKALNGNSLDGATLNGANGNTPPAEGGDSNA